MFVMHVCVYGGHGLSFIRYEVQTTDGRWHNTTISLSADETGLLLTAAMDTGSGVAVNATRGNFSPWPVVVVYSGGFPALPWDATPLTTPVPGAG